MARVKYGRFYYAIGLLVTLVLLVAPSVMPALAEGVSTRPTILLNPREGPVGAKVYITLSNFSPGTIDISFNAESNIIETDSTDKDGNLYTSFTVEEYPAGKYKLWATDSKKNREIIYFTVLPAIKLDNSNGRVGDQITTSGTGFAAYSEVNINFDSDGVAVCKTDEDGCLSGVTFNIPEGCNGNHTVKATDKDKNFASASFSTEQSIIVSAKSGSVGTGITVSGSGFAAKSDITIYFANNKIATSKSDDKGSFNNSFVVPAVVRGTYRIKVSDGSKNAYADFAVSSVTTLNPTKGSVGTEVTVNGAGFMPTATVIVKYDKTQVIKANTSASGTFEINFNVPVSEHGDHTVTITDSVNTAEMVFTMESSPPQAPRLLLPASGSKVSETPTFSWESVTDPSGVTCTLQVSSDPNFSAIALTKSNLTALEYIVTEGEKLQPRKQEAPYYWRVKAIDRASNIGEWSTPGSFYMGISLAAPPGWIQWGLTGLGITLFGFLFGTFLKRLRNLAIGD